MELNVFVAVPRLRQGAAYLDAVISDGSVKTASGQLSIMASGIQGAFDGARPLLEIISETVFDLGDRAGFSAPTTAAAMQQYLVAVGHGLGHEDDSAITEVYARNSGLKLPGET